MLTNEAGEVTRYPLQSYLFFRLNKHVLVGFFFCVFFFLKFRLVCVLGVVSFELGFI